MCRLKVIVFVSFRLYRIQFIALLSSVILLRRLRGWVVFCDSVSFNMFDGMGID